MASIPSSMGEVLGLVAAMDAALLPCLPARELQAADRSSHPSLHVDVERHSKEFMDAAKKIQLFFIRVGHQYEPSRDSILRKEIAALEEELKVKDDLMQRQLQLVSKWRQLLRSQKAASIDEIVKV
ncbi:unnamed protein product [Calypogeia fissa]